MSILVQIIFYAILTIFVMELNKPKKERSKRFDLKIFGGGVVMLIIFMFFGVWVVIPINLLEIIGIAISVVLTRMIINKTKI